MTARYNYFSGSTLIQLNTTWCATKDHFLSLVIGEYCGITMHPKVFLKN